MGRKRSKSMLNSISKNCIGGENTQNEKIVIDINQTTKYDASNPLVIVAKKKDSKKLKVKEKSVAPPKPLSKKQRRKLQKIIEMRKKKLNRAELFQKLSQVQATTEVIDQLTSTSDMQTFGIRRLTKGNDCNASDKKISNIRGINKKSKMPVNKKRKLDESIHTNSETEGENSSNSESDEVNDSETNMSDENEPLPNNNETTEEKSLVEKETNLNNCQNDEQNKRTVNKAGTTSTEVCNANVNNEKEHISTVFIPVNRNPDIQALREALPIYAEEQPLMEAIRENSVVIIHGETGSGKTTQVPQFLYEAGFTQNTMLIGITEPRRIAAMSMAARVGEEMNMPKAVSYHIRYEKTVNPETKIKFMTDGVLLKEMKNDFHLSKYSVIIIDEAHERSVFSDVLIGLLSRVVNRHKFKKKDYPPLKLIIMSATMCVEEFMENPRLFKEPPFLFKVSSRQYTVQAHFIKNTPENYIEAAYDKVCKIHRQLPSGAILVFLTGENEIKQLCKMLRETFSSKEIESDLIVEEKGSSLSSPIKRRKRRKKSQGQSDVPDINLDNYTIEPLDAEDLQHQLSEDEEQQTTPIVKKIEDISFPLLVLPLYSVLPLEDQEKVFKPPPPGSRLCVVATNVAETSITIPGLKYVVDSGKVKTKVYNKNSGGISKFVITWCSKASSNQRAGRAGRTEGGHCYRLYSSAVFDNELPDFSPPEILRIPSDDVLLQMKALGITNVVDFPFPSPPDAEALKAAERRLVLLGALKDYKEERYGKFSAPVTPIGKAMARFPLSPRYAAMLLLSKKHNCISHIVAIVCAMTVPDVFQSSTLDVDEKDENSENSKVIWPAIKKIGAGKGVYLRLGDVMVLLRAVAQYETSKNKVKFCIKNGIRNRAMIEIHKMQLQLYKEMSQAFTDVNMPKEIELEYPTEEEIEKVRKIVAAGLTDHIARRIPAEEGKKDKKLKNAYQCMELEEPVFIHPSSILFSELPEYVAYQEIVQTSRYFMKGVIEIEDNWIPCMVPSICEFSDPLEDPPPSYDSEKDKILVTMDVKIGCYTWEIRVVDIEIPKGIWKYKWFCFFLLDGQILNYFAQYKAFTKPSIVLKNWAKSLAPKMMLLLNSLISKDIDCRKALESQWETDSSYLLREFLGLLPSHKHLEVECKWPPKS